MFISPATLLITPAHQRYSLKFPGVYTALPAYISISAQSDIAPRGGFLFCPSVVLAIRTAIPAKRIPSSVEGAFRLLQAPPPQPLSFGRGGGAERWAFLKRDALAAN